MIARAVERGTLAAELEFWTDGLEPEPIHETTSLSLMMKYAPGVIA
jgi:hypothetical protein